MSDEQEYRREDVVDAAGIAIDPPAEYFRALSVLDGVVRDCMSVSRSYAGILAPSGRHFYASVLFTALLTRAVSLVNLAPFSPWSKKLIEHWDYATAAGIARTMLELRLAFYYLCVEECPGTEWECRWNVFNLHDCNSRVRLFEEIGNAKEAAALQQQAEQLRDRLRSNEFFMTLTPKQQKRFLLGRDAYMCSLEDIGEKAGVEKTTFRWIYLLFSTHVHGLPMSFYRIGEEGSDRGRGLPSPVEENYTRLCLSFASTLLVKTRDEIRQLFMHFSDREKQTDVGAVRTQDRRRSASELPVGSPITVATSETTRITITRVSDEVTEISYFYPPTNELILKRTENGNGGSSLEFYEPVFWNVSVNDGPATPEVLKQLDQKLWTFEIDLATRSLQIKVVLN